MKKTAITIAERKKALIDEQDYLSEEEKKKAKEAVEKNENKEEQKTSKKDDEKDDLVFYSEEDRGKENEYSDFGNEFLNILKEEQAAKNKENDLPGYRPKEKENKFNSGYNPKQSLSDSMALRMGVSQKKLDEISREAAEKFGKDIFSEAVDSGVVNIGADIVGGGDFVLEKIVGWKNNPLTKPNEYLKKIAAEEEKEVMEAVEKTGKGSSAEFSAKVIVAITEALPDLALALMSGGGSTATTAAKGIKKVWNSTAANPNFWYAAETQLYPIYEEALLDGATEDEALKTALGGAFLSAGLEGSLGFEKYTKSNVPMTWKKGLENYVKAGALEGVEEAIKASAPEAVEKWVFNPYKPLLKAREGKEAVLNLSEAKRDFLIGGAVGMFNSTPKLFDISMDAYGNKIVRDDKDNTLQMLLENLEKEKRSS